MAFPTAVNNQITDSISQANTGTLNDSPALATSKLMVAVSQALSNAAHNAASGQESNNITAQAALVQGVNTLQSVNTASSVAVIKAYS
ncbi:RebB family R body protein [Pseudoalteromonas piscicida]|uniref:Glycerol-3-phosphate dehydrogenase n=1 Tax=Pseudoalteromonas piscicida TaxID=43662 RepID=A0A2A5JRZ0_PSEO7|nr:RebB family R body protein [Pseudoalteromonas piscicida]PCK32185.1 glycerol-3-phosphate dehydrogenase [Pseudoalteromonas piscicida]